MKDSRFFTRVVVKNKNWLPPAPPVTWLGALGAGCFWVSLYCACARISYYRRDARIPQRPSHHPRMTRPSRPRSDMSVGHHLPTRNLADDIQYILAKRSRLLRRHLIGVVTHLSCYYIVLANKVTNNLAQIPLLAYFSPQKLLDLKSFRIFLWCTGSNNGRPAAATA